MPFCTQHQEGNTTHNQERETFPSNYVAQRVKLTLCPMASLHLINVQQNATELPSRDVPVSLMLHCTNNTKIWQQWSPMRRQIFTLYLFFILSYFYLLHTKRVKRFLAFNIKKWGVFFPLEVSKTSKALNSYSKFFKVNRQGEWKSNLLLPSDRPAMLGQ